jgi:antitoxin VapB
MNEFDAKQSRLLALLAERGLDALLLQRVSSFAWATCGANSAVNIASTHGAASLLVTPTGRHLITNNLEAARLEEEEGLIGQGWQFHVAPWYERDETVARLTHGLRLAADGLHPAAADLSADLARLRSRLTPEEAERMAALAADCALAVARTAPTVAPGQTEQQINARLAYEAGLLGIQPITAIVAADERIYRYRHALSTQKPLARYLMLALNGRRHGLVSTVTRFMHFGPLPDALKQAHEFTGLLFDQLMAATRPGRPLGEALTLAQAEYARVGAAEAWRQHHQGGAAGYEPREFFVTPGMTETVAPGQAFVWNPALAGARSVDQFIVGEAENRIVSHHPAWPTQTYEAGNRLVLRPAVWVC